MQDHPPAVNAFPPAPATEQPEPSPPPRQINIWAIVTGVLGAVILCALAVAGFIILRRRQTASDEARDNATGAKSEVITSYTPCLHVALLQCVPFPVLSKNGMSLIDPCLYEWSGAWCECVVSVGWYAQF